MKKMHFFVAVAVLMIPATAIAVSSNAQGQGASSSQTVTSSNTNSGNQNSNGQVRTETNTQTQTNNPGTGTMTQTQTEERTRMETEIEENQPKYTPSNSKSAEHMSTVADVARQLIGLAYQIENTGLGDRIKLVAQTQTQNQDKIGQAIDNTEKRSSFAKFFIGSNYKELNVAKTNMEQNQIQIQELNKIMSQLENDTEKLEIANQIIVLQNTQLELKEQINNLASGFSLFGWINRWVNNY